MIAYNDFAIIGSERSYRILKITPSVVHMHKMKFSFKNAVGHPYGTCFEIKNGQLHRMSVADTVVKEDDAIDDEHNGIDAAVNGKDQLVEDNNKIDLENAQKLTAIDVKNLKDQGAKPSDLIAELAKNNKNFEHRTQYSKEKYLAKKKKKHSNVICIFKSTVRLLSHVYYHKDTDKICGLRLDHLSSILNYADVQPGTKVLVVENCAGLVTGGVLERLAGNGACLHFHRNDQAQAIPALNAMNFDEKQMSTFYPVSFKRLADNSIDLRENCESTTIVEDSQHKNEKKRERSQSPIIKESGEKSNEDESNERRRALRARREEAVKIFQESKFDSLIIACKQHPLTFLKHLTDKMEPSSPLVIYSLHVRMSQEDVMAKERILNKIERCLIFFQNSLIFGPRPTLHVAGLDECCPIEAGNRSIYTFTCAIVVLCDVYKLLLAGSHRSKRAIFYDHKQLFGDCATLDRTLKLICQLLQEPRVKLNILSSTKGLIMGDLMFRLKDGVAVDCNIAPTQVPPVVDDITEVVSNAKFILIVEKETIFQRLQDEEFCSQFYPCMMITAKGYPDYATRQMLQLLLDSLQIPMYVLVDGDPYDYQFSRHYLQNDCDINVNNVNLNCIQWLGVLPSEISRLNFPKDQYLALTDREKSKLRCMSDRASEFADERFLVDQLQIMLELGLKVELEALCSLEASYLSQVYLRSKLAGLFESAPVSQSH